MSIRYIAELEEQTKILKGELGNRFDLFKEEKLRPYMKALAVIARATQHRRRKFQNAFEELRGVLNTAPYAIVNQTDPEKVIVWPNLPSDLLGSFIGSSHEHSAAQYALTFPRIENRHPLPCTYTEITMAALHRPVIEDIIKNLDSESKHAKKWDVNNPRAGQLFFLRKEKMGIDKFLSKYIKILETFPAARVEALKAELKQRFGRLEIKLATTEKEVFAAYTAGPQSCMSTLGSGNSLWQQISMSQQDEWFHPALFYFHSPDTELLYAKRDDTIVARTVLFVKNKKCSTIYGDPKELKTWLNANGYESLCSKYPNPPKKVDPQFETPFKVKGTLVPAQFNGHLSPKLKNNSQQVYICPWPFVDYFTQHAGLSFDNATKEFTITPMIKKDKNFTAGVVMSFGGQTGYIHSDMCVFVDCAFCNGRIFGTTKATDKEGNLYCTDFCAHARDLITATQANGTKVLAPKNEVIVDAHYGNVAWTTEYSAMKNGAKYILMQPQDVPSSRLMTKIGLKAYHRITNNMNIFKITGDEIKPVIIPFKNAEPWSVHVNDDTHMLLLAEADEKGDRKAYAAQFIQGLISKNKDRLKEQEPHDEIAIIMDDEDEYEDEEYYD